MNLFIHVFIQLHISLKIFYYTKKWCSSLSSICFKMILRHYCIKHTFTRCSFWVGHIISCRKLKPFIVRSSICRYFVIESEIMIHNLRKTYCLGNKFCILHNIIHHWHKFALVHFNFRIVLVGKKHPLNIFRWTIFEVSTPISKGTNKSFQPINTETNFSDSYNQYVSIKLTFLHHFIWITFLHEFVRITFFH